MTAPAPSSSPQRQRVWIAMVLAQDTPTLLLDEPATYLDMAHAVEVLDLLVDRNLDEGTTVAVVLHDLDLAARYADHLVAMRDGAVVATGTPAEVVAEETVGAVFGTPVRVIPDPVSGTPLVVPIGRHRVHPDRTDEDEHDDGHGLGDGTALREVVDVSPRGDPACTAGAPWPAPRCGRSSPHRPRRPRGSRISSTRPAPPAGGRISRRPVDGPQAAAAPPSDSATSSVPDCAFASAVARRIAQTVTAAASTASGTPIASRTQPSQVSA